MLCHFIHTLPSVTKVSYTKVPQIFGKFARIFNIVCAQVGEVNSKAECISMRKSEKHNSYGKRNRVKSKEATNQRINQSHL